MINKVFESHIEKRKDDLDEVIVLFHIHSCIHFTYQPTHVKRTNCYMSANKLLQTCSQAVDIVFALLVPVCCNNFGASCRHLACVQACNKLDQGWSNKSDTVMI